MASFLFHSAAVYGAPALGQALCQGWHCGGKKDPVPVLKEFSLLGQEAGQQIHYSIVLEIQNGNIYQDLVQRQKGE